MDKNFNIKHIFFIFILPFLASAAMLTVIQAPIDLSIIAWISYVPFIITAYYTKDLKIRPRRLFLVVFIISFIYWLINLYWIFPITIAGGIILCAYTALLWPVLFFCLQFCIRKKIPLFLACAILIVGIERMQGLFLGGFFWRFLAHSQYKNTIIIQIADIFGAGGVSFLVALVNGIVAELFIASNEKKLFAPSQLIKSGIVICIVVSCIFYGKWRISQEAKFIEDGPTAASLQTNVPQSVKNSFESSEDLFDGLMVASNAASESRPELIVWPETMVQATLNPEIQQYLEDTHIWKVFDERLREHAKDNAYLLVGAYGGTPEITEDMEIDIVEEFNSAFLYNKNGEKAPQVYNKIHLVPFGEFLPLRKKMAWFYQLLMKMDFIPYKFDYSLDHGSRYTVFNMTGNKGQYYKFSVMICYEGTVPLIPRKLAIDEYGNKRINWLVNISNDGWFVRFKDNKILPSTELPQHAAICAFRAVENRLAILRSVNTGISCLIDTYGRIKKGYHVGTLPHDAMERTGMPGWFIDTIPIDKRTTFFSKHGEWLDYFCEFCVFFVIIISLFGRFIRFKKRRIINRRN